MEKGILVDETGVVADEFGRVQFFSSGSTLLDLALGGGWACGRTFNIVGDRSTGKTLLAVEAFANFKRKFPKGKMRYAEAEAAFDEVFADKLGFPKEVERPDDMLETVEDYRNDLYKFAESLTGNPGLYILDSLDALSDEAEQKLFEENADSDSPDKGSFGAAKAKKMSQMFRNINQHIACNNCANGVISQIREKLGVMFGEKYTRSGGKALDFYASQVLWLSEVGKIEAQSLNIKRAIGVKIRSKVKKLKVGTPFREADFPILFGYGVDDETSMLDWLGTVTGRMTKETIKDLTKQIDKARDVKDYKQLAEIFEVLKKETTNIWNEVEANLAPTITKYR